jgi:hypothetical protein
MEPIEKKLSEITRNEWIAYQWQEEPNTFGDEERIFLKGFKRTPDEARQAMEDWDLTAEERESIGNEEQEHSGSPEPSRVP